MRTRTKTDRGYRSRRASAVTTNSRASRTALAVSAWLLRRKTPTLYGIGGTLTMFSVQINSKSDARSGFRGDPYPCQARLRDLGEERFTRSPYCEARTDCLDTGGSRCSAMRWRTRRVTF